MSKYFKSAVFVAGLLLVVYPNPSRAVTIAGIVFDDDAFASEVISATPSGSGQFAKETLLPVSLQLLMLPSDFAILEAAVVGSDVNQSISLRTADARLTVGFTELIPTDGPGDDIAIVELGTTAPVGVTIGGTTLNYTSQPSGTANINFVFVDLSDFGVSQAPAITISSTTILNDIAAIGALNSVPEPSTFVLAGLALAGIAAIGWRQRGPERSARQKE